MEKIAEKNRICFIHLSLLHCANDKERIIGLDLLFIDTDLNKKLNQLNWLAEISWSHQLGFKNHLFRHCRRMVIDDTPVFTVPSVNIRKSSLHARSILESEGVDPGVERNIAKCSYI